MAGQDTGITTIDRLPAATLPLAGTERLIVQQGPVNGGVTVQLPLSAAVVAGYPTCTYAAPINGATLTATSGLGAFQIDPAAELATLNLILPPTPVDTETFEINSTQIIDALTVTAPASGTVVKGGSAQYLAQNGGMSWRYLQTQNTWFRRY